MKEDILEQLVEDWFVSKPGWFVKHNIKFTIIANRLSTIKNVDEIILLDQGKIVNNGTH